MQIQFDPAKDALNIKSHGLSLTAAAKLEWEFLICHEDNTLHDYFEQRMVGFAPIADDIYCVVFVERDDDVMRVISLRKATKKEVQNYVTNQN